jgi:DNA invertase Pin-like site-specific DNA recombinase
VTLRPVGLLLVARRAKKRGRKADPEVMKLTTAALAHTTEPAPGTGLAEVAEQVDALREAVVHLEDRVRHHEWRRDRNTDSESKKLASRLTRHLKDAADEFEREGVTLLPLILLDGTLRQIAEFAGTIGYPKGKPRKPTPEVVAAVRAWTGSKAEIARRLGISRQTVYEILKRGHI